MKSVLISINPKWCELIALGKKTVEVRKTKPKLDTPFKCYIYETKGKLRWCNKCQDIDCERPYPNCACHEGWGKVIGEFVCDNIITTSWFITPAHPMWKEGFNEEMCLTDRELFEYSNGDIFHEWHISDLVIYDKPRELSEFYKPCENLINGSCKVPFPFNPCAKIGMTYERFGKNGEHHKLVEKNACLNVLHRPPQSWCYVERSENGSEKD